MRHEYTLVFEFPDNEPKLSIDNIGAEIEDIMNAEYPHTYQDVIWKQAQS